MPVEATVKILRFDPSVDKEPHFDTYQVPAEGWNGLKIIDTLRYIYENMDGSLSFREPCRQRLCGACNIMVNQKPALACNDLSVQEMVIEPLPKYKVIKDLVIDLKERAK
jgi:succinate dehydrogenase/fumarate reductase iron-sulfur protein